MQKQNLLSKILRREQDGHHQHQHHLLLLRLRRRRGRIDELRDGGLVGLAEVPLEVVGSGVVDAIAMWFTLHLEDPSLRTDAEAPPSFGTEPGRAECERSADPTQNRRHDQQLIMTNPH